MAKYTYVNEPATPERLKRWARWTRQRREADGVSALPEGFTFKQNGRYGFIYYREADRVLEVVWEMSGDSAFDLIVTPSGLREWVWPQQEAIPDSDRLRLRVLLEGWLQAKGYRPELVEPLAEQE